MYLCSAKEKKIYKVKSILEGKKIRSKLSSMGIFEGTCLEILKNDFSGPVILKVKESRISIGRGLSSKIEIEEL